ncbi:MAG: LPS assembly lipoprotein LptE [Bacteroidales bacterium]|nr:LPS assembly lipoprotein LptE [Bacteroidales bacterium]
MTKKIIFILTGISVLFSQCGIYSFSGASLDPKDKTVNVKFFQNRAAIINPNLSQLFTEQLKDRFVSQTKLELVDFNGDLTFEGEITGYNTKPIAITQNEQAESNRLTITVHVKYTSINNPKFNFDSSFSRYADYESSKLLTDVEDDLTAQIVNELIDDIFNKSVVNW